MKRIWLGASLLLVIVAIGLAMWATVAGAAGDAAALPASSNLDASTKTAACVGPAAAPCSLVRYGILLANAGASMPRVSVHDPLPPGMQYVLGSAQGGLQYDNTLDAMTWIGSLPAKSTLPLTFTVRSLVHTSVTVTNVATICGEITASACITRSADILIAPAPAATPTATPTPPAGLDCAAALPMSLSGRYYAGTTGPGASAVLTYGCAAGWLESGPEAVYTLTVDRPLASFTVSLSQAQQDLDLFVLSDCNPLTCVAAGDRTVTIEQPAGTYYIVVDGQHDAQGAYLLELTWVAGTPAPTATASASPTAPPSVTGTVSPSATATPATPTATATPTQPLPTPTPTYIRRPVLPLILHGFPRPPAPTSTPTPSYPVSLEKTWIEGPKGVVNASFRPCEVLYEYLRVINYDDAEAVVRVDWIVRDMSLREVPDLTYRDAGPFAIPGGHIADIALPAVLPPDATLGSYELKTRLYGPKGLIDEQITYFTVSLEDPVKSQLAELVLSRAIVDGLPAQPVPDGVFSAADEAVYAWVWLQRMSDAPHTVTWVWFRPDGQRYDAHQEQVRGSCTVFAWGWMRIAGSAAAVLPGIWRLEVRLDGQLLVQRSFQILNAGPSDVGWNQPLTGGGYLANPCLGGICPPPAPR